ncbi:hypothetical protein [Roseococcus pinisoli]|uniref:Uncharacterized protein n=1 Tax=Roseococcus pinisoli TaxID=2835040 RepID=A0ABS5QBY3_9PROT|nr:hypothetical protein [Roseococcus pinisoli]MBS7811189.1 hypothetical protein [Roseococcus pinisoli]
MSTTPIPDDAQLPDGLWAQILQLVRAGQDSLEISIATGISRARAERYRRELSFKPAGKSSKLRRSP